MRRRKANGEEEVKKFFSFQEKKPTESFSFIFAQLFRVIHIWGAYFIKGEKNISCEEGVFSHTEFMLWNREMIIYMQNVSHSFKKEKKIFALPLIHL